MDRIIDVTHESLNALLSIRAAEANAPLSPETLHTRMRSLFDRASRRAAELGFSQHDINDIGYALVAFADETMLARGGALRDYWLPRPLQLHYFHETLAGENFFVRLDAIRQDPNRADALRVFHLCLLFGFRGKYAFGGEFELAALVESIGQDLQRAGLMKKELALAPSAAVPDRRRRLARSVPALAFALTIAALSLGAYGGMRFALASETTDVSSRAGGAQ